MRQYAGDALFVWGEVDDFKHFLPRIFELEVAHGDSFVDPQPPEFNVMEIEDWLCGIAQAEAQLSPYLGKWLATETDNARLNLAAFIAHTDFAKPNRHPSDYWNNRPKLFDEVAAWVRSEAASRTCWSGVIAEKNTGTD